MNQNDLPLEITCKEVKSLLDAKDDFLLLDCREQNEHQIVRMSGAHLLPMSELVGKVGELADHRERTITVYCHHGGRSLQVATWLREQGFLQARSMVGGIDRWAIDIEPGMLRY